ncbi:MAG: hypothetical protein HPY76_07255 [Anaerolineae bacterium]|jgi:hypothetical protein|nr:hypothetical protein [Anaerolineae bacterium]
MDDKKSQHYNFTYEAVPVMFHSQTSEFMKYIEQDGTKFLKFWWDHVGGKLPTEKHVPFKDVKIEMEVVDKNTKVAFIELPRPTEDDECYFMALVKRPERYFAWVRLPTNDIYCLVRRPFAEFPHGTEMMAITPRGNRASIGAGIEPRYEDFKTEVMRMVTETRKPNPVRSA